MTQNVGVWHSIWDSLLSQKPKRPAQSLFHSEVLLSFWLVQQVSRVEKDVSCWNSVSTEARVQIGCAWRRIQRRGVCSTHVDNHHFISCNKLTISLTLNPFYPLLCFIANKSLYLLPDELVHCRQPGQYQRPRCYQSHPWLCRQSDHLFGCQRCPFQFRSHREMWKENTAHHHQKEQWTFLTQYCTWRWK